MEYPSVRHTPKLYYSKVSGGCFIGYLHSNARALYCREARHVRPSVFNSSHQNWPIFFSNETFRFLERHFLELEHISANACGFCRIVPWPSARALLPLRDERRRLFLPRDQRVHRPD